MSEILSLYMFSYWLKKGIRESNFKFLPTLNLIQIVILDPFAILWIFKTIAPMIHKGAA